MTSPLAAWVSRRRSFLLLQVGIVITCVCVTSFVAVRVQEGQIRAVTIERVTAVAQSLAELPAVVEAIEADDAQDALRPLAELVREASAVDYVVITDATGIRFTHPDPQRIGEVVSTDPTAVLGGVTFVGVEEGTLGPSLRAKVPVVADGAVIGTVSVGLLEARGAADLGQSIRELAPWVIGSLLLGLLAAAAIDRTLSARVRRLEAGVRELDVQRRLAEVLRDQTHEFANRLHIVYGLVEGDDRGGALDYIGTIVPVDAGDPGPRLGDVRIDALLATHAATLRRSGGELRLDPSSRVDGAAIGPDHLTVIANLVANAVDAACAGERMSPAARIPTVDISIVADSAAFRVVVADSGPGLTAADLKRVFHRGVSSKLRELRGGVEIPRGVGLALVADVVRTRHGVVDVGTSPHGGARFVVELPGGAQDQRGQT